MKRNLLLTFTIVSLVFINSCGSDDEPALAHEVGQWTLDSYALQGFPVGFESNEGTILTVEQVSFNGLPVDSYMLTLNNDGTYQRTIDVAGPDLDDNGTWTLDDDDLILNREDGNPQEFNVEKNEDNDLWLTERNSIGAEFIPDIYFDTVTQAYLDYLMTLNQTQLDSIDNILSEVVQVDLVYIFDKQ